MLILMLTMSSHDTVVHLLSEEHGPWVLVAAVEALVVVVVVAIAQSLPIQAKMIAATMMKSTRATVDVLRHRLIHSAGETPLSKESKMRQEPMTFPIPPKSAKQSPPQPQQDPLGAVSLSFLKLKDNGNKKMSGGGD